MPLPTSRFDTSLYKREVYEDPSFVDETLDQILSIFKVDDVFHDDFLRYIEFFLFMWDIPLLPRFNHLVELLMRKIYFSQADNPMLAYVPIYHLTNHSDSHYVEKQGSAYLATEGAIQTQEGLDSSIQFEYIIDLYCDHIDDIIRVIKDLEKKEEEVAALVSSVDFLNHRQKQLLVSTIRSKQAEVKIQPYQRLHNVAYATARQDLFDLMEKGFVSLRKRGKAFVFQPLPREEWPI